MRVLLVDDEKTPSVTAALIMPIPEDVTVAMNQVYHQRHKEFISNLIWAKTVPEGIELIKYGGPWDIFCLDHDMGDHKGTEITALLKSEPKLLPQTIFLTSFNPIGKNYMRQDLEQFYKNLGFINAVVHLTGKLV